MDDLLFALDLVDIGFLLTEGLGIDAPFFWTNAGVPPELKAALEALTERIEVNPSDAQAHFRRGAVCQGLGIRRGVCRLQRLSPAAQERPGLAAPVRMSLRHAPLRSGEDGTRAGTCHRPVAVVRSRANHFALKSAANAFAFSVSPVACLVSAFQVMVLPGSKTFFFMKSPTFLLPT